VKGYTTAAEEAERLGRSKESLRAMIKMGLPCFRIGARGKRLFSPELVDAWLRDQSMQPKVEE
jgi:hypothetical protein